jgi:hypothetical protein
MNTGLKSPIWQRHHTLSFYTETFSRDTLFYFLCFTLLEVWPLLAGFFRRDKHHVMVTGTSTCDCPWEVHDLVASMRPVVKGLQNTRGRRGLFWSGLYSPPIQWSWASSSLTQASDSSIKLKVGLKSPRVTTWLSEACGEVCKRWFPHRPYSRSLGKGLT